MKRVMILGLTGMLGSMVTEYLSGCGDLELIAAARNPDKWKSRRAASVRREKLDLEAGDATAALEALLRNHRPDYVINCIGITKPYCKDNDMAGRLRAIRINSVYPYALQRAAVQGKAQVLQIATDCVYSGKDGRYTERSPHDALDVYGKTKSLGEVEADNMLHIRCSIIGPEKYNSAFLLEWFNGLPVGGEAKGFAHHLWNGVTTLQFAQICHDIISERRGLSFAGVVAQGSIHHYVPNSTVDKFELMNLFSGVYGKPLKIERVDNIGPAVDRTLGTEKKELLKGLAEKPMRKALEELKAFTEESEFYA